MAATGGPTDNYRQISQKRSIFAGEIYQTISVELAV